jgi:hypothetical protein
MSVLKALQASTDEELIAYAEEKIDSASDHSIAMVVSEINEA